MITRSTLLHVRLPFSWFLLPVFMMALALVPEFDPGRAAIVFIVLHLFLYTASNGFNSYFDRDTESIGALRRPPAVTPDLLWFSLALDAAGLLLALMVRWEFALGCFIYGMASKIYSWDLVRVKKYPITGWIFVGVGQGVLAFLLITLGIAEPEGTAWLMIAQMLPASIFAGFFLLGVYPLTQIYQHGEDARRGDVTISRLLGIKNTFYCAAGCLVVAIGGFFATLRGYYGLRGALLFIGLIAPAVVYFVHWYAVCRKDPKYADFSRSMRMNLLASTGVNLFGALAIFISNKW